MGPKFDKVSINSQIPFLKSLFVIAFPIILQNFLASFLNMLDTIMVGQLGKEEIAAVGLANQIFFVMSVMLFGIVSGGSIFISQFWGKKDLCGVHRTMGIMLSASSVVVFVFFILGTFFPEFCLKFYSNDEAVISKGAGYLKIVSPGYLFMSVSFSLCQALRSTEHVKLPLMATGISVAVNGILNVLLIFGLKAGEFQLIQPLGLTGAAIATDIARFVELMISLVVSYSKKYEIAVSPIKFFQYQPNFLRHYFRICFPVMINETLWGIGISLQNSIYGHSGTSILAAFSITSTISNLVWTFFIGCGIASAIMIGKKIGASLHEEARLLVKKLAVFMTSTGFILGLVLIPMALCLKFFFNVDEGVLHMAQVFLLMTVLLYPFYAFNMFNVVGVCRSGGDTIYAMIMDVGFMWIISIPLGFCAVYFWNFPFWAIFICLHIEDLCKCLMGILRLKNGRWLHDITCIK